MSASRLVAGVARQGLQLTRQKGAAALLVRHASGGGGYNEPTGRLFGEKPPAAGKKRAKEDWEDLWTYGMFGGMAFGAVLLWYKPDTKIQTWATQEARKRLEASEGVWKYEPSPNSGYPSKD